MSQQAQRDDAVQLLRQTQLFAHISGEGLQRLAERAVPRRYRRGEILFHQHDTGDSLHVVVEGLLKVYVTSADGDEMLLVTLRPSSVVGELPLVDGGPRSASAAALEDTTVLTLNRADLLEALHAHPQLLDALLRSLGAIVRRLTDQAADLVFLDLPGRLAKLLVRLASEQGPMLEAHLTQSDLASMVGASRQSVNEVLQGFARLGYVSVDGRRITVERPEALRRRAGLGLSEG